MGMALKEEVLAACQQAGTEKPVDLVHLSSITMGDPVLEAEILSMFVSQIPSHCERARECGSPEEVRRTAHTIKGSARSIGATRLVQLCEAFEENGNFDLDALDGEFHSIATYISSLR